MQNIIQQLILKAKSKKIVFENLTTQEQQAVTDFAKHIQQIYKTEFLSEDVIFCINRCKGDVCYIDQKVKKRIQQFNERGRTAQIEYEKIMNGYYD